MSEDRKEITKAELNQATRKGLDYILDNIEVKAVVTVKDKHGNVKGTFNMDNARDKENVTSRRTKVSSG
jgi:hypothetical protein